MKNNRVAIEGRNYGKTTFLYNEFVKLKESGKNLYVMDSATEHVDKSLIRKIESNYSDVVTIDERNENNVVLSNLGVNNYVNDYQKYFPFQEIVHNIDKIVCFDLSFFLEKGHEIYDETKDINRYTYYRNIYNILSEQIALALILCARKGIIKNSIVLTDEIEFPITSNNINIYQSNIEFLSTVHPENAFGSFYDSFEKIRIKQYKK